MFHKQIDHPLLRRVSCWRLRMETLPPLMALCDGNPPISDGFSSQRVTHVEHRVFSSYLALTSYQTNSLVIGDLRQHGVHVTSLWRIPILRLGNLLLSKSFKRHSSCFVCKIVFLTAYERKSLMANYQTLVDKFHHSNYIVHNRRSMWSCLPLFY